ncbi:Cytochrome c5 [invertebrate metagenome]|uniref:Cytochrome c5 n=1 Tax=invertebrate metagenome TaxID=1711999 RepID=A0A2H9TBB0_9ZZZZ
MFRLQFRYRMLWSVVGLFSTIVMAKPTTDLDDITRQEIAERLAPVGQVCEEGQPCSQEVKSIVVARTEPRSGEQVYNQACFVCHQPGSPLPGPKLNDAVAWAAKLQERGSYGQLLSNAISGIGGMPARGTCMDCSNEEISQAIQYMSGLKPE